MAIVCICQHEERHHDNEASRCDKIGCHCELFRPDLEDYTDIKFGPIEESPIEGYGEEEIDRWIGRRYQEQAVQIAALTAALRQAQDTADGLRALVERTIKAGSELFSDPNLDPHWHWKDYLMDLDKIIVDGRKALGEE